MMRSKITIHDIARSLKISPSTVSRALNDNPRISESTRQKVKVFAQENDYTPNILASSLRKGRSLKVGIVVPRINRHFFSNVIGEVEEILNETGYNLIICQTLEDYKKEIHNIKTLVNLHVDAIFISLSTGTKNLDHIKELQKSGIHLVMFDRVDESLGIDLVKLDDFMGSFNTVQHLINQGCRNIVHFGGPTHILSYHERQKGYSEALEKNNIQTSLNKINSDTLTKEKGYHAMINLIETNKIPDAIFSASDYSALGAVLACRERNIEIPKDICIAGFANEPFTEFIRPGLTSTDQKPELMGKKVAELFLNKGSNKDQIKSIIKPELIIRESTLKL
jgi:LacI family transcriptional regulator, galactose operon repressor